MPPTISKEKSAFSTSAPRKSSPTSPSVFVFPEKTSRSGESPLTYGKQKTSDSSSTSSWASQGESPPRYGKQNTPDSANTSPWFSEEDSSYSPFSPSFEHHVDTPTLFGDAEFKSPCAAQKPSCPLKDKVEPKVYGRPPLPRNKGRKQENWWESTPFKELKTRHNTRVRDTKIHPKENYDMPGFNLQLDTPLPRNEGRKQESWKSSSIKTPLDTTRFRETKKYPDENYGMIGLNLEFHGPTFGSETEYSSGLSPISEHSTDTSLDASRCSDTASPPPRSPLSQQLSPGSPDAREHSTQRLPRRGSEGETDYRNRSIRSSDSDSLHSSQSESGELYSLSDIFTPPPTPNTPTSRQDPGQPELGDGLRPRALFRSPTEQSPFSDKISGTSLGSPSPSIPSYCFADDASTSPGLPSSRLSPPQLSPPQLSPPQLSPPQLSPPELPPPRLPPPRLPPPRLPPPRLPPPRLPPPRLPPPRLPPPQLPPPQLPPPRSRRGSNEGDTYSSSQSLLPSKDRSGYPQFSPLRSSPTMPFSFESSECGPVTSSHTQADQTPSPRGQRQLDYSSIRSPNRSPDEMLIGTPSADSHVPPSAFSPQAERQRRKLSFDYSFYLKTPPPTPETSSSIQESVESADNDVIGDGRRRLLPYMSPSELDDTSLYRELQTTRIPPQMERQTNSPRHRRLKSPRFNLASQFSDTESDSFIKASTPKIAPTRCGISSLSPINATEDTARNEPQQSSPTVYYSPKYSPDQSYEPSQYKYDRGFMSQDAEQSESPIIEEWQPRHVSLSDKKTPPSVSRTFSGTDTSIDCGNEATNGRLLSVPDISTSPSDYGRTSMATPHSRFQDQYILRPVPDASRTAPTRAIDNVQSLTGSTFSSFIKKQGLVAVMFHNSAINKPGTLEAWKTHSLKGPSDVDPKFASVDCNTEAELCAREAISTQPFFKLYSGGYLVNAVKDFGLLNYDTQPK